jgi:hypothetical protein
MILGALHVACAPPSGAWLAPQPLGAPPSPPPVAPAIASPPPAPCAADADCAYEPTRDACAADPRANHQPPLRDQGLVCYCDAGACALLRVPPVPCESDESCAVRADPRPHPVAASAAHPHERGRACRDFTLSTTCERTNICTMTQLPCGGRK